MTQGVQVKTHSKILYRKMYTLKQNKKRKEEKEARPENQKSYVKVNELDDSLHRQGSGNQAPGLLLVG